MTISSIQLNLVFPVNANLLFATCSGIWKYRQSPTQLYTNIKPKLPNIELKVSPNPTDSKIEIKISLINNTQAWLLLLNEKGQRLQTIANNNKVKGDWT